MKTVAGDKIDTDSLVTWCRSVAKSVRRTSRAQHLKAIACAHAFFLQLDKLPGRELIMRELEREVGRKRSVRTTALHIIAENFISYAMGTPAERAAARKLCSRDTRAIEFLRKKRVRPSQVEALAREKNEGVDRWSRQVAVPRQRSEAKPLPSKQEAYERSLRHVLLHVIRKADGTEVEREKVVVTNALASEVKTVVHQLKKLGASL